MPGIALTFAIAVIATLLRYIPGVATFSSLILAIIIGIAFHNLVKTPIVCIPGVKFSMRFILRFAIILYGLQLTITDIASVGVQGFLAVSFTLAATFVFTVWVGRWMGVERKLAELVGAGTAVCGAAAVVATNTVTQGSEEDVAYGVACVTVYGTIAMFLYPLLPPLLHLDARGFGLWSGSSIHEVAQVVATSVQNGPVSAEFALISKLTRVALLAPLVLCLGFLRSRGNTDSNRASAPVPWFVFGFLAMVVVNSFVAIPAPVKSPLITYATPFLLAMATAAMGLETDIRKLKAKGLKPLLLGGLAWLFIAALALTLVYTVMMR
ncbi:MAG: putative sulfate exporter family transporter [Betaproteobacteria bacterium]|nr:putative sulfate exporter family transporter [Betaproteobacteria bacterium]